MSRFYWYRVRCLAFRPDGAELATCSDDGMVRLWDVAAGRCKRVFTASPSEVVWAIAYSPDGQSLATGGDDRLVKLWDAASGHERLVLRGHTSTVCCLAFSPDGRRLVSAGLDAIVRVWATDTGGKLWSFRGHTDAVKGVAFSQDGRRLGTASEDGTVRIWDVVSGPAAVQIVPEVGVGYSSFSPDGQYLALNCTDSTVRVCDAESGAEVLALKTSEAPEVLNQVGYSPDGRLLATATFGQKAIQLRDAKTGRLVLTGPSHDTEVAAFAFSPDSRWVASVSILPQQEDKVKDAVLIKVWNVADGRERFVLRPGEDILSMTFSPDGKLLAVGTGTWQNGVGIFQYSTMGRIRFWDAENGREIRSIVAHAANVWSLAFSADGKRLASGGGDRTVKIWDVLSGKELLALQGHTGAVGNLQFSRGGERLASAAWNFFRDSGETIVWDTAARQPVLLFDECFHMFSPDGRSLITGRGTALNLWRIAPFNEDDRLRREAMHLFQFHREKLLLKEDILQALRRDATVREPVRQRALALAERYRELPERLNAASWKIARAEGAGADAYRLALRQAEAASRLEPKNVDYLITLGAARYRAGFAAEALRALKQANAANLGRPAALVFLALAQKQLGEKECLSTLERLREIMKQPVMYRDGPTRTLVAEARKVLLGTSTHVLDPASWHVVGPFDNGVKDSGLTTEFPPEKAVALRATYRGKSSVVAWQTANADIKGYVDLLPAIVENMSAVAYAYCEVESPADQEATILLGTDDSARLWVNGKLVYTNPRRRPYLTMPERRRAVPDEDQVRVPLRKGRNAVLLKIVNYDFAYGFYLRLESPHQLEEIP